MSEGVRQGVRERVRVCVRERERGERKRELWG